MGLWTRIAAALLVVLAAPWSGSDAQGRGASVVASFDSPVLKLGGEARMTVVADGVEDARLTALPEVDGLEWGAIPRPSRKSFFYLSGGRQSRSSQVAWTIDVRPTRVGRFEIPGIAVTVDGAGGGTELYSAPLVLTVLEDLRGEELGFLEVTSSSAAVYEGQPFELELLYGWDESLRQINVAELTIPWWGNLPGLLDLETPPGTVNRNPNIVMLNGQRVEVEELPSVERKGRPQRTFRLRRSYLPTRAGALELATSSLEFSRLERTGGILGTSSRLVEQYFVLQDPIQVDVRALPEEGRPFDFSGAVGTLTARASADVRDVDVGDSLKVSVEWSGRGNLEFFELPDLGRIDAFSDFRVYGSSTVTKGPRYRKAVCGRESRVA